MDWGALAQGVSQLATTGLNAWSQGIANKDNRHFAEGMMDKQRQWALDDWNMQNAYNSPAQQMQRYKEAGLNPNLVYNQQNIANPVRSTETARAQAIAPHFQAPDIQGIMAQSQNIKLQKIQTDNMAAQRRLIEANILNTMANTSSKEWMTERSKQLMSLDLEKQMELVRKLGLDADLSAAKGTYTVDENARRNEQQPWLIKRLGEQAAVMEAQQKNMKVTRDLQNEQIKKLASDIDLNELKGISMRQQQQLFQEVQTYWIKRNQAIQKGMDMQESNIELNRIKARFRELGLSETVVEKLLDFGKNLVVPKFMR